MMIGAGILGLLQSCVLPGLLVIRLGRVRGGLLETLLWLFPLSLSVNYLLVFTLSALGIYRRPVLLGFIALEILVLLWSCRAWLKKGVGNTAAVLSARLREELLPLKCFLSEKPCDFPETLGKWIRFFAGCLALSGVLWGFHLVRLNFGTVFSGWDTLFSWNAFAELWAEGGGIPLVGGMYPQLLPANWSLSYVLQGEDAVQLFNTLLPPLFFLAIQLMFFDLGLQRGESAFFFAAILSRYMLKKLIGDGLFDGYMDVPVAAMSLYAVYAFLKAEGQEERGQKQRLCLGLFFAAAAAVTKQSGWIVLALSPLMVALWLKEPFRALSRREKVSLIAAVLLLALPWYGHCLLTRASTADQGGLIATGIQNYNARYDVWHRVRLAVSNLGKYALLWGISLVGLPLLPRKARLPLFLLVWPLTVVWAYSYSYDARNLCAAMPFTALSCGLVLTGLGSWCSRVMGKIKVEKMPFAAVLFIMAAAAGVLLYRTFPDEKLSADQTRLQKELFGERLNRELLYDTFGETHSGYDIYTDYPAWFLSGYKECCSSAELTDAGQMRILLNGDKIHWMLLPEVLPNNTDDTKVLLEQCIEEGRCQKIRCSDGYFKSYCLYKLADKE